MADRETNAAMMVLIGALVLFDFFIGIGVGADINEAKWRASLVNDSEGVARITSAEKLKAEAKALESNR